MRELIARKPWKGSEGKVRPGQTFTPKTEERAHQLIADGRAVEKASQPAAERKIKGGPKPADAGHVEAEDKGDGKNQAG